MRRTLVVGALSQLAVGLVSCAVQAQAPVSPAIARGYATIQQPELRSDLAYVASDALEGRMSLEPGDEKAVQWIAQQFARAGLTPAAKDAEGKPSFLQPLTMVEYHADTAATSLTLKRDGQPAEWKTPAVLGSYRDDVDVSAPVVFAGYGITAPELGYDDYKGLDAHGKIVLLFDHEPQEDDPASIFNGTGNTRYATSRVKLLNAQGHGAVAVILVAEPNRHHLTNAERSGRIGGAARSKPIPLQAIADDELHIPGVVVVDEVADTLLATDGEAHGKNGKEEASALQSAIDKDLTPQSRALAETTVTLHLRNTGRRTGTTWNVAGLLEGSDPKLKAETILITAHHDHNGSSPCPAGEGGIDAQGQPTPPGPNCLHVWHGADDNGSGTVGVVALARAYAANGLRPKRSILFVVFATEERGLLGSYYMAQHPLRPLATTRAQINFDMIGRDEKPSPQTDGLITIPADTSNRLNLIGALYSPEYNAVVHEENAHVGLVLDDRFDHESALNVFFRSDQFPFVLHNVPAFWWFTGFHPDYHHITDTVEKIDYAKMQKILELAYLCGWRFASDAHTPVFVANPMPAGARH
ncbi:MAG TPA: M20/M25/M40 family metallo-hydrolase [Acidobacteriaceae bacterium]|nr:M20/M25/M40 family metallo-hydrolase [Acidobacteriaceae bacterium]